MSATSGGQGLAAPPPGGWTAGVDEAGRGPLAGPVVAAAVVLHPEAPIAGVTDSKRLSARRREALAVAIRQQAAAWAVVTAEVEEIDALNIAGATMAAMTRAVAALGEGVALVRVDGNRLPALPCRGEALVGGDRLDPAIGAASILAKVARDARMVALHERWPEYGFAGHKGYPTRAHLEALERLGPTCEHRRSFAPVRRVAARQA